MNPLLPETPSDPSTAALPDVRTPDDALPKKAKKDKKKKTSRGVETLFRTTMSNHIRLSEMADRKANLMISINTIVISIMLSAYARTNDVPATLLVPSIVLLGVSLVTIITSLIATNPTISPFTQLRAGVRKPSVDLLFFGYYNRLSPDEYRQRLRELLSNDDEIYTSMIDNIYAQGKVLDRKYRLLKFAYQFFMIGFSAAVIAAVVTLLMAR